MIPPVTIGFPALLRPLIARRARAARDRVAKPPGLAGLLVRVYLRPHRGLRIV